MTSITKYQPTYTNITDWTKKPYSSTGGTRAKNIYTNQEQVEYFFKGSKKLDDGTFRYPMEFWSEIVSSKIGQWLGFDLLDYNIAFDINDEQQIGCLSKSMVEYSENRLSEGVDFLRGFNSKYNPKEDESQYTLEFIKKTLYYFKLTEFEDKLIEMLIFDSIIGNSDRHQENWGFISKFKETIQEIDKEIDAKKGFLRKIDLKLQKFLTKFTLSQRELEEKENKKPKKSTLFNQSLVVLNDFSPIYDSGCCLGRELLDPKIEKLLNDKQMIESFLKKGKSEIRLKIGKKKPSHFDVILSIKNEYPKVFKDTLDRINKKYSKDNLELIINKIDNSLPLQLFNFKLPDNRKELMIKLINLRINKLNELCE